MGWVSWPGDPCRKCGYDCKRSEVCNCCPWCCEKCNKDSDRCYVCLGLVWMRKARPSTYKCNNSICDKQCTGKEKICQCDCCQQKCTSQEAEVCKSPPPAPQQLAPSPDAQHLKTSDSRPSSPEDEPQESNSQSPPYSAIAAVIVAVIVAIILLDLCIFRFPVGRNIRDCLVRKIPFCIAFYS